MAGTPMNKFVFFLTFLMVAGCATAPKNLISKNGYAIDTAHSSQRQNERIRYLVLHYTVFDDDQSLAALTTGTASAHYLALTTPTLFGKLPVVLQLVTGRKTGLARRGQSMGKPHQSQ